MSNYNLPMQHVRGNDTNFVFFFRFCRMEFPLIKRHTNLWEGLLLELRREYSSYALLRALNILQERKDSIPARWDNVSRYFRALLRGMEEEEKIANRRWAAIGSNYTIMIGGHNEPS